MNYRILIIGEDRAIHEDIRKILAGGLEAAAGLGGTEGLLFGERSRPSGQSTFEVESAWRGLEGWRKVQEARDAGRPFALAFLDVQARTGADGVETINRICGTQPDLQVAVCMAGADYPWEEMIQRLGKADSLLVLRKPFDAIELAQLAHALTEKWRLSGELTGRLKDLDLLVGERTADLQTANLKLRKEIADQIKIERQLDRAQKMEAVGQLAAGVAHDFNNLLAVVQAHASRLLAERSPETPDYASLRTIASATNRAARLVRQLLTFSGKQVLQPRPITLREALSAVSAMLPRMSGETIRVKVGTSAPLLCINADPGMVGQMLMNLAANAREAMPQGGVLSVSAEPVEISPLEALKNREARLGKFVCFSVSDTGRGVPPEVLPRLFEPFFTTKPEGEGVGLGLAMVYGIAQQHGGWVECQSQPGQGSTFRVFIPVLAATAEAPAAAGPRAPARAASEGGDETILVVDDEVEVCGFVAEILRSYGYKVFSAESGSRALDLWAEMNRKVHLLLTDVVMPGGLSGCQLARRLLTEDPALRVLYTSGYGPEVVVKEAGPQATPNFLPKPYAPATLLRRVRASLDGQPVGS